MLIDYIFDRNISRFMHAETTEETSQKSHIIELIQSLNHQEAKWLNNYVNDMNTDNFDYMRNIYDEWSDESTDDDWQHSSTQNDETQALSHKDYKAKLLNKIDYINFNEFEDMLNDARESTKELTIDEKYHKLSITLYGFRNLLKKYHRMIHCNICCQYKLQYMMTIMYIFDECVNHFVNDIDQHHNEHDPEIDPFECIPNCSHNVERQHKIECSNSLDDYMTDYEFRIRFTSTNSWETDCDRNGEYDHELYESICKRRMNRCMQLSDNINHDNEHDN